jgi:superfamily I DNA and/or RNA helicase
LISVFVIKRFAVKSTSSNAAEILSIIANPAMVARSIGVVTLLGNEQAIKIDDLIRRNIPTNEIVERKIRVGEPPVFQGRESDLMLLSMVLAKSDRGLPDLILHQQSAFARR